MRFVLNKMISFFLILTLIAVNAADILDEGAPTRIITTSTESPPASPYLFSYAAGRYPGHIDRTHTEVSDGTGVIRGQFSYIDPKHTLRTVEYVADRDGFHPRLSPASDPQDTEATRLAKARHFALYNKIAEANSHPQAAADPNLVPKDTAAVSRAKKKHERLYERIVEQHARIGAEQEAQRRAFEATSIATTVDV